MRRLLTPPLDFGVPYLNQDFFNVLQGSNLSSYRSMFDLMNDRIGLGNSGIIMKGINLVSSTPTDCNFNFADSIIYLDGDFLEPNSILKNQTNFNIQGTSFYLIKETSDEQREMKVTGFQAQILDKSYFGYTTVEPAGLPYIEVSVDVDGRNISSRYLDRIMRYYVSQSGEVQMSMTSSYFDTNTGKGFGPMFGFHICNGQDGTIDLQDKFLVNYDKHSKENPNNVRTTEDYGFFGRYEDYLKPPPDDRFYEWRNRRIELQNYDKLQNMGGIADCFLTVNQIPNHDHGGRTTKADNELRHQHEINVNTVLPDSNYSGITDPRGIVFGKGKPAGDWFRYTKRPGDPINVQNNSAYVYARIPTLPGSPRWREKVRPFFYNNRWGANDKGVDFLEKLKYYPYNGDPAKDAGSMITGGTPDPSDGTSYTIKGTERSPRNYPSQHPSFGANPVNRDQPIPSKNFLAIKRYKFDLSSGQFNIVTRWEHRLRGHVTSYASEGVGTPEDIQGMDDIFIYPVINESLEQHKHDTDLDPAVPTGHNNLPPYLNVIYYEKWFPY